MKFYTVREIAQILQIREDSVTRLIRSNKLMAYKIGGSGGYRIKQVDLDIYLESVKNA